MGLRPVLGSRDLHPPGVLARGFRAVRGILQRRGCTSPFEARLRGPGSRCPCPWNRWFLQRRAAGCEYQTTFHLCTRFLSKMAPLVEPRSARVDVSGCFTAADSNTRARPRFCAGREAGKLAGEAAILLLGGGTPSWRRECRLGLTFWRLRLSIMPWSRLGSESTVFLLVPAKDKHTGKQEGSPVR